MGTPQSNLPPGFRFHPTDEELILHYLRKKVASVPLPVSIIAEVDIYKCDPWDLPAKAAFGEKEWYFFSPRDRKYPNGARPNRAAASGYWKATDNNKPIKLKDSSMRLDDWVLCRIYKKSKYALPATTEPTVVGVDEHDQAEEYLFKDTILPPSSKPAPAPHNALISQKSLSFSNLLDAMDYSMLSSFLSDQNHPGNPTRCGSTAPIDSLNLDQSVASPNQNSNSNSNSYLFQLNNPSSAGPTMENCRPKRELLDIDEDLIPSSKKYLSSCNFANSANTQYENPQWNLLLKPSLLNQQLLLGPHLLFQG
ncbi:hypothetical protein L6164_004845 [Bauhinia variegata]|uniref:Uncharacterized protein n=1 Tax=Bauhinia variegata TaxID=167791 RepID=A0ACB9PS17_BAUVA|nr:hypothetical protein L6164_004845 [Bauhinia variegata]